MRPARRTDPSRLTALLLLGALGLVAAACVRVPPKPEALTLTRVAFAELPGWTDDRVSAALAPLARSCARLGGAGDAALGPGTATLGDLRRACAALPDPERTGDARARAYFERWFVPYRAADGDGGEGLFTGYYEIELDGARTRGGAYTVPIHRRPPDLVSVDLGVFRPGLAGERLAGRVADGRLRPYATRAEIENGALAGRDLELVWVDDPVDAFFLHIQGSGRVRLDDGGVMRLGYAGDNGHPYVSVGRVLLERRALGDASMQGIRAWMHAHPEAARELRARNPRYIFFRALDGDGPVGSQGVVLTPGRSLAVDTAFVPLGIPVWLDAGGLRRLMVAQDTGGAIKGPVRGDVFWGFGETAAERAGRMKITGGYYLLLPRPGPAS